MKAAWTVGIDLGTTHTVVAFAPAQGRVADDAIQLFDIEQLVAPGEVASRPLLPSMRYHPATGELAPGDLMLPWMPANTDGAVIGTLARRLGAQVPGRLVSSAKSWLSHGAVDRLAPILPWGAPAEVPKVSPVQASASYLSHVRAAWNLRFPQAPLEHQELVLTVPASFDDAARTLSLAAASDAGLPRLRLLEEPQAALYDWLFRHRLLLATELTQARLVLVCDVGGGTTDLSLVRADWEGTEPRFERIAVGRHLMLGGDNMDLALAHLAETRLHAAAGEGAARLTPGQFSQLVERCRAAKEKLLGANAPDSAQVTLLGSGSRLIGGARSVTLGRDEVERIVLDGFFPQVGASELPRRERASGLVAFGLPYASDPAVTRHVAGFLQQHARAGWPDALLLNGGVFHAQAIAARLHATLGAWRGVPLQTLRNTDPDVAVARGAVAFGLARRGLAPKIGGGSARSYFLPLDDAKGRGVCVLPRGCEEGREVRLEGRSFELRVGEPVRFHLVSTTGGTADKPTPLAGDLVELDDVDVQPLPPVATVVQVSGADSRRYIPVQLAATLTEVGTLEMHCISANDPMQRWKLEFRLRDDPANPPSAGTRLPPRFEEAVEHIERVFGARDSAVGPKAVKQLRLQLEALLGRRERWPTQLLRPLFDALLQRARGRHRSPDHERLWLSLTGWCLRPGFGHALDEWRIEQLWPLFETGVQHGRESQIQAEWWTLWRRVAGGLDAAAQQRLLQDFAINLRGDEAGIRERPPQLVKGGWDDMVRLGASLERIPIDHKVEIGDWLVERLQRSSGAAGNPEARDSWTLWAIGRIGARAPLYGGAQGVVPAANAAAWLDALLALDWKREAGAAAAAANLARLSGDRARDLPLEMRERVIVRLQSHRMPPSWIGRLREVVPLDEAGERGVFGEALPPGLRLVG
ncbi:Hsp70 family protein [Variovorax sp. J22R133]|uniref:Hsp70 family protein n=1 Tax=Variovorax brevis TaxID=3053503 RepID=UPI0025753C42|nr:Hsp70 family protein [Variovorax sp. J22R133]MDM0117268.1 Hsp70 family protein [Variovorax sp. J22R133]